VALEEVFQDLLAELGALREGLDGLRTTVREDRPLRGDTVLVDLFGDAADDLLGLTDETSAAAAAGLRAAAAPADLDGVRRALAHCAGCRQRLAHRLEGDLLSYERIAELLQFGRSRGGEWRAWATSVKAALDWCRPALEPVGRAIDRGWVELTERMSASTLAVQTMTIGRQIRHDERAAGDR
jgi:hypothetical protein